MFSAKDTMITKHLRDLVNIKRVLLQELKTIQFMKAYIKTELELILI